MTPYESRELSRPIVVELAGDHISPGESDYHQ